MSKIYLTLDKTVSFIGILFALSIFISPVSNAGLVFYDDRAAFEIASGLSGINEDFESANVAAWDVAGPTNSFNALTNDGIFSTGDIATGVDVSASEGGVFALGVGLYGDSKTVGAEMFSASTILSFDSGVQAIGLDLYTYAISDVFDISIFGFNDLRLHTDTLTASGINELLPSFFGVISDDAVITKIDFNNQSGFEEVIDNITYGNVANVVEVPEPSSVFMLLTAFIALCVSRKKV